MKKTTYPSLKILNRQVVQCHKCPRLVEYREQIPKRTSYADQEYWRLPNPGYGDPNAQILLLGLAPSAHGGNRTGRIFTGDESGRFLMQCLYQSGLANQRQSLHRNDGLQLNNCYMTAIVKCVPPKNLPTQEEKNQCRPYWVSELALLSRTKIVITFGSMAFKAFIDFSVSQGFEAPGANFKHGKKYTFHPLYTVYASYHPSPQNTYTNKLTSTMLIQLLNQIKESISK